MKLNINWYFHFQRQAERIKREKAQTRRGDDAEPQAQPDLLVPISRFDGSRLASGPRPSPYQQSGSGYSSKSSTSLRKESQVGQATTDLSELKIKNNQSWESNGTQRASKVARLSSSATVGAAIVEAENSLEIDVRFLASGKAFNVVWPVIYYVDLISVT